MVRLLSRLPRAIVGSCFVLLVFVSAICLRAEEVPWLAEVQRPPAVIPAPARPLAPLLTAEELAAANARAVWEKRRITLRQTWLDWLGPMPERPTANQFDVLERESLDGVVRTRIRYENEPDEFIDAYLLQPTQQEPIRRRPGIVALHATTELTNGPIAGIGGRDDEQLGWMLAQQGFVVICPRNFLWRNASSLNDAVEQFHARHPQTRGIQKMLYDAQRATDLLAQLPDVDPHRLGAVGHSLGAKEVLYLMAFDERLAAGVFSEGGIAFDATNWHAPWYLGEEINRADCPRNHHELLALIAPRPFLVLGGESGPGAADGDRSWPYLNAALPIYSLYGPPTRLGLLNHHEGHSLSPASYERLAAWLTAYLPADQTVLPGSPRHPSSPVR